MKNQGSKDLPFLRPRACSGPGAETPELCVAQFSVPAFEECSQATSVSRKPVHIIWP
jgi:hypothetical protein